MRADHGAITCNEAESSTAADSTITVSESDFLAMASGQQNPTTAFMQGRLQVSGNLALPIDSAASSRSGGGGREPTRN